MIAGNDVMTTGTRPMTLIELDLSGTHKDHMHVTCSIQLWTFLEDRWRRTCTSTKPAEKKIGIRPVTGHR